MGHRRAARRSRRDHRHVFGSLRAPTKATCRGAFWQTRIGREPADEIGCALLLGFAVEPAVLKGFGPLAEQPRALIVFEMLAIGDFFFYWTHRFAHTVPWMWRLHAVHHSTTHMRWSSALRAHPGEAYVQLVHLLPLFLLGFPIDALVPVTPFVTLYAMFIHCDLNVSLRPVSYLFNSPLFHRWHHARDVRDGTTNFAGMFPFYDALFGTYRLPARAPRELGIEDSAIPDSCIGQLAYPFLPQKTHALHDTYATRDSRVPTISAVRKPGPSRLRGRAQVVVFVTPEAMSDACVRDDAA